MKPQNVELHIEELVLHGFAPGDRHRIGEAVRARAGAPVRRAGRAALS